MKKIKLLNGHGNDLNKLIILQIIIALKLFYNEADVAKSRKKSEIARAVTENTKLSYRFSKKLFNGDEIELSESLIEALEKEGCLFDEIIFKNIL